MSTFGYVEKTIKLADIIKKYSDKVSKIVY